jgi:hypothetical protein
MNARTRILPSEPASVDHSAFHRFSPPPSITRYEGRTPDKRRRFLEAVLDGHNVLQSCAIVGLSKQSAYPLRTSPRRQSFILGWRRRCSRSATHL